MSRAGAGMSNRGFTLIELMVVIALISILSSLAIPLYKHRVIKAQVTEAMALSEFAKEAIVEYRKKYGFIPGDNLTAGLPEKAKIIGNYVKSVAIVGGAINIQMGNRVHKDIDNKILTIRPAIVEGENRVPIAWICGNASVPDGMTVKGVNQTSLLASELTIDCRF